MYTAIKRLVRDESGQDLAEYAIALAVITLAVIAAVQLVGTRVGTLWNNAATTLQNAAS
jgi:Flp pilus assembly pilin Flp